MMSPCHTPTTENRVAKPCVRALVWPLIALLGSCAWGGAARSSLEAPQPVAALPQPVAELSEERGAQACPEGSEGSGRVKFYLADQLGDSLRMRDHCDSSEPVEPNEGRGARAALSVCLVVKLQRTAGSRLSSALTSPSWTSRSCAPLLSSPRCDERIKTR